MSGNIWNIGWHIVYAIILITILGMLARFIARSYVAVRVRANIRANAADPTVLLFTGPEVADMARIARLAGYIVAALIGAGLLIWSLSWGTPKYLFGLNNNKPAAVAAAPGASDNPTLVDCKVGDKAVGKKTASDCDNLNTLASLIPPAATVIPLVDCKVGDKAVGKKTASDCDNLNTLASLIPTAQPAQSDPPTRGTPPTTSNATPVPATPSTASAPNPCAGDKISTVNEVEGAGPQRREIGGGEVQLVDHYPDRGILPITFVLPEMRHWLWWGFGSTWGYHGACSPPTTVIEQALAYTTARGEWHTGVTLDLTGGTVKMIGNDKGLSNDVINSWLSIYGLKLNGPVSDGKSQDKVPATLPANLPKTPTSGANGGTTNCTAVETKYTPTKGQDWVIPAQTQPAFALIWSNEVTPNWVDHKVWVGNAPVSIVSGGGSLYVFPVGCDEAAKTQYANNSFKEPTPAESAKYIR